MGNNNFTTSFITDHSPDAVFAGITNVCGWWSECIEGNTDRLNAEFLYYYKDVHTSKMRITEMMPGRKVVWHVLENHFNFIEGTEWKGNDIVFEISEQNGKTLLTFTQIGLTPADQCYNVCHDAWTSYIQGSLRSLIETGKGRPNASEGGLNAELVERWGLPKK